MTKNYMQGIVSGMVAMYENTDCTRENVMDALSSLAESKYIDDDDIDAIFDLIVG